MAAVVIYNLQNAAARICHHHLRIFSDNTSNMSSGDQPDVKALPLFVSFVDVGRQKSLWFDPKRSIFFVSEREDPRRFHELKSLATPINFRFLLYGEVFSFGAPTMMKRVPLPEGTRLFLVRGDPNRSDLVPSIVYILKNHSGGGGRVTLEREI